MKPIHVKSDPYEGMPARTIFKVGAPKAYVDVEWARVYVAQPDTGIRQRVMSLPEARRLRDALDVAIEHAETDPGF